MQERGRIMVGQYLLQLMLSKGIGDISIKKILHHVSIYPEDSLESFCNNPERLSSVIKCRNDVLESIRLNKDRAEKLYQEIIQQQISIIIESDTDYPTQLKEVLGSDCPPVLFVKGNRKLLSAPSVGFCGSRKVSPKGITITAQCAEQLVNRGITVVSGYAAGTDLSAHTSAMIHGGNTIFVLAEGILKFMKKQVVKELLTADNHVFVSQFLPQASWNVGNAMKRNSIIIGLSKAMILVESGKSGGTFAAGEEALQRGQPLFVIDYAKPEVSAEANPYFIERGGQPIRGRNNIPNLERLFYAVDTYHHTEVEPEQLMIDFKSTKIRNADYQRPTNS